MRPLKRRGFTLIEMMMVILLALLLMGLGANAFKNLSNSQKLSIGAGAVHAALQQARAHALKTRQVTAVYFLDSGECTPDVSYSYYDDPRKMSVPYELVIWADDEVVNSIKLPEGIAWMDLNKRPADYDNPNRPYYHRACSLVINFTPSGSAWAEILDLSDSNPNRFDASPAVPCRTKASYTNIRVFNLDSFPNPSGAESLSFGLINSYNGNKYPGEVFTIKNTSNEKQRGNKQPSAILKDAKMRNFTWLTVNLNYQTGIAEIVNGPKEMWTEP